MIYLLKTKDDKEITKQTLDLFRSVEGVEITKISVNREVLADIVTYNQTPDTIINAISRNIKKILI